MKDSFFKELNKTLRLLIVILVLVLLIILVK